MYALMQIEKIEVKKMKTYTSKDFYLSSYLIANGSTLLDNIVENGVTTFVFENNDEVKKL